jgi:peptidoglycan/xylan/chitin deacetylase (PgdA/CDA1 family)
MAEGSREPAGRPLGLRIDVDTHEGMRTGVPRLLATLGAHGVRGSFFLSFGPDRAGLAVRNLLRPGFLAKMLRTRAPSVYGPRTLLSGTLLPAREIALALPATALAVRAAGHEVGVHAWDHRRWQDRLPRFDRATVAGELDRAFDAFVDVYGEPPRAFAAPAWLANDLSLRHQESYGLVYASDCRGVEPFRSLVDGEVLSTPQVPTTLPTLDEGLGDTHGTAAAWFDAMVEAAAAQPWPSLTVHAELEGGPYAADFSRFLDAASARGLEVVPLVELLAARRATGRPLPRCPLALAPIRGRHGAVATQGPAAGPTTP